MEQLLLKILLLPGRSYVQPKWLTKRDALDLRCLSLSHDWPYEAAPKMTGQDLTLM